MLSCARLFGVNLCVMSAAASCRWLTCGCHLFDSYLTHFGSLGAEDSCRLTLAQMNNGLGRVDGVKQRGPLSLVNAV